MNQKEKKQDPTLPENRLKFEIAEELGLMDKIRTSGWKGLSSRESGLNWRNHGSPRKTSKGETNSLCAFPLFIIYRLEREQPT